MSINKSALATAIAAAIGASVMGAPSANAAPVSLTQMGSSAVLPIIEQVWHDYCVAGTLAEYRDATAATAAAYTAGGGSYRIYTCTIATNATTTAASIAGDTLTYNERGTGGSIFGVVPVAQSSAQTMMTTTGCTNVGAIAPAATAFACSPISTTSVVPDIGISDVEPGLFYGSNPNLPAAFPTPLNAADQAKLTATPFVQQVFGVGVGSAVKASVTSLTTSQISSILNGTYSDWHEVNSAIAAGTAITVCERTPGSGTQAGANAIFLNNPCAPLGQLGSVGTAVLNASTSTLIACLNGNAGHAIGILGLADGPKAADTFALVSIGGTAPSASNAATGSYPYEVESTINTRAIASYTAEQQKLINALAGVFSDPASLSTVNTGLPAPAVNALSANYAPSTPYAATNPVEWGSRGGSTCAPYTLLFP
jgi:ABC-type phosphate transport system substrate-binding protein